MRSHHCCSEDLTCRWDQKGGQEDNRCFNKPVEHSKVKVTITVQNVNHFPNEFKLVILCFYVPHSNRKSRKKNPVYLGTLSLSPSYTRLNSS
jgi:hypothetical protein